MKLSDRELNTVLAALRFFQAYELGTLPSRVDFAEYLDDHPMLTDTEVDELCYELNTSRD